MTNFEVIFSKTNVSKLAVQAYCVRIYSQIASTRRRVIVDPQNENNSPDGDQNIFATTMFGIVFSKVDQHSNLCVNWSKNNSAIPFFFCGHLDLRCFSMTTSDSQSVTCCGSVTQNRD